MNMQCHVRSVIQIPVISVPEVAALNELSHPVSPSFLGGQQVVVSAASHWLTYQTVVH